MAKKGALPLKKLNSVPLVKGKVGMKPILGPNKKIIPLKTIPRKGVASVAQLNRFRKPLAAG